MSTNLTPAFKEVFNGDFQRASIIQQMLEAHEIPSFLRNGLMASIEPFAIVAGGSNPVSLDVSGKDFDAAATLIEEFEGQIKPE